MYKIIKVVVAISLDKEFDYYFNPELRISRGMRVLVDFNGRKRVAIVVGLPKSSKIKKLKPVIKVLDQEPLLSQEQIDFAKELSKVYPYSRGEFLFMMLPSYLKKATGYNYKNTTDKIPSKVLEPADLNESKHWEKNVFIKADDFLKRYSLWKDAVSRELNKGSVLICFPQLSYLLKAKQIIDKDFPNRVRVICSQNKEKDIFFNWEKTRNKTLMLGTRMSIFYYPYDLGLIIVEEENNACYFQEEKPFYHLLDVAFLLARLKKIKLILSGDFPSLYTYNRIKRKQIFLKESVNLPKTIKIIDTGRFKQKTVISPILSELLRKMLKDDKRGVVLWNKKGFSRVISCSSCGHVFKCEHCSAFLQLSLKSKEGICPYCQKKASLPKVCNYCQSGYLKNSGYGIERVGLILKKMFPEAKVSDWQDKDSKSQIILSTSKILSHLYDREVFDLGFVLDADSFLARTDYNATFSAFIYFKQLSFLFRDALYIFTNNRNYYLFEQLNEQWNKFYDLELSFRKKLNLPPFGLVAKLTLRAKDKNKLLKRAEDLYNKLEAKSQEVYGPFQENPFRLRDKFRYSLIVKTKRGLAYRKVLKEEIKKFRTFSSLNLSAILQ